MEGKKFTIVVKGPRAHNERRYPIVYGSWSSSSSDIYKILCIGVPSGCSLVDSNCNVPTQNLYYINEYKNVEEEKDPAFDVWVVEDDGLQTSQYYDPKKDTKDSK